VSSSCIRLFNHDIIDLQDRVSVRAPVVVLQEARESFRADAEADDL
jgi:lipoprotein-anchoring transpeptidase ErfK/SrfK